MALLTALSNFTKITPKNSSNHSMNSSYNYNVTKSPDPDMQGSWDEISGGVDEGQLDADRRHGWW